MILDREQFIKAVNFLKPVMSSDGNSADWRNYIRVQVNGVICVLTAADFRHGKRITLEQPDIPMDIEEEEQKPVEIAEQADFLINRAVLESFATLCQKHKTRLEAQAKKDSTLLLIDIFPTSLESHKNKISCIQPIGVDFPNYNNLFHTNPFPPELIQMDTDFLISVLKEFSTDAEFFFGSGDYPLSIKSPSRKKEAFIFYRLAENEQG